MEQRAHGGGVLVRARTPLATARLELRPTAETDREALHELCTDAEVRRYLFDARSVSADEVAGIVARSSAAFDAHGYGLWLAYLRVDSHGLLGFAGLLPTDGDAPGLYYAFLPQCWGRGLATEASAEVLRHAFDTLALPRVRAEVDEPNAASIRVLTRLGMLRTGRSVVDGRPLISFEIHGVAAGADAGRRERAQ